MAKFHFGHQSKAGRIILKWILRDKNRHRWENNTKTELTNRFSGCEAVRSDSEYVSLTHIQEFLNRRRNLDRSEKSF
jgi:hypothetical protein